MTLTFFQEPSAADLLLLQLPHSVKSQRHFDLLEANPAAHQHLADVITAFIIQAQVVAQVDLPFDGLATAVTVDSERVKDRA